MNAPKTITVPLGAASLTVPVHMLVSTFLEKYAVDTKTEEGRVVAPSNGNRLRIGARGLYGIYAGIARGVPLGVDGDDDYIIEVLDEAPKEMSWQEALKWAQSIDGTLPTRREAALLYANVPELFRKEAYWTSEQSASTSDSAWYQHFHRGYQYDRYKSAELRARAVRRLNIQ